MEVILDADDKIVESLHGLVEDVEPENGLASAVSPVATPAQPLETNDDAEFDSLFPDFEEPTTQDHHQDGNTR